MIAQTNARTQRKHDYKKVLFIILMLFASVALITTGIVAAYFSDVFSKEGTGSTGTLKISGSHTYFLNGTQVDSTNIGNLNPGDVIVIAGTVSNTGTHSAWIREKLDFSATDANLLPFLKIYEGQHTQSEILGGADLTANEITLEESGVAVGDNLVIAGSDGVDETGSFNYVSGTSYNFYLTIYFDILAGNEAQNLSLSFTIATQALQFKNNNAQEPSEAAWNTVTAVL